MHQFTDDDGRIWTVAVTVAEVEAIQDLTGLDIGDPGNFEKILGDTRTFCGVLWPLIADQAAERKLDAKAVKRGLRTSVTVEAAADAVRGAVLDFFPRLRPLMEKLSAAIERRAELAQRQTAEKLDTLTVRIDAGKLDAALGLTSSRLDKMLRDEPEPSNSATGSPASAEPTPAP